MIREPVMITKFPPSYPKISMCSIGEILLVNLKMNAKISSVGYTSLDVSSANSELKVQMLLGVYIWHLNRTRWIIIILVFRTPHTSCKAFERTILPISDDEVMTIMISETFYTTSSIYSATSGSAGLGSKSSSYSQSKSKGSRNMPFSLSRMSSLSRISS